MRKIIFQWGIGPFTGWGVYGLNLALNARGEGLSIATACPFVPERLFIDAARLWVLRDFIAASRALVADLAQRRGRVQIADALVLHCLYGQMQLGALGPNETNVTGARTIGVGFFEDPVLHSDARERGRAYEKLIVGSQWNAEILRANGLDRVEVVLQGIDPSLFHPAPRAGLFAGRFAVFSGGKLEFRKGQDIVLKAFALFHRRHPDSVLLTAWQSPTPKISAETMTGKPGVTPVPMRSDGGIDVYSWTQAFDVPATAIIDLGALPNALMPPLLREADAGLFPNRCEGGTNLVAMEAMACGVPTVLSANTGHLDLIQPDNCYALRRQFPVVFAGRRLEGWGESDPEEIVAALEAIYTDREMSRTRGSAGAATLAKLSWQSQIRALLKTLAEGG